MKSLHDIHNLYFVGIGGIGMSALAFYFKALGKNVAGYDKTPSSITQKLEAQGIDIFYDAEAHHIPEVYTKIDETLVVYTPAVADSHEGLHYFRSHDFIVKKRAEVLGIITHNKYCLAVAGTHGKTTTSSLLGHLLATTGVPVTAFLGGIAENYDSNLIQNGTEVVVVEADEFDRSFHHLQPDIASITSLDADHLDIYGDAQGLQESFKEFAALVKENGKLIINDTLPLTGITVGFEKKSQYSAQNIKVQDGAYHFDLHYPQGVLNNLILNLPGRHNLSNAVTALAMAIEYGSPTSSLGKALFSFKGVHRRFSYRVKTDDLVLIDDYAHHPTEIDAVHNTVREMYPQDKILVVFQPHLYSRTRDFMDAFAKSLAQFDELLLLDIYPAREQPIPGIDANHLLEMIEMHTLLRKQKVSKEALAATMQKSEARIQLMLGAGDIGEEVIKVTKARGI